MLLHITQPYGKRKQENPGRSHPARDERIIFFYPNHEADTDNAEATGAYSPVSRLFAANHGARGSCCAKSHSTAPRLPQHPLHASGMLSPRCCERGVAIREAMERKETEGCKLTSPHISLNPPGPQLRRMRGTVVPAFNALHGMKSMWNTGAGLGGWIGEKWEKNIRGIHRAAEKRKQEKHLMPPPRTP